MLEHQSEKKANRVKWFSLFVLSLALAIIIIDGTVLNVSIKYLLADLKTDYQSIQWVITSYSLVLAALLITGGRLGDLFGRKKMFMLGAILFAVGSFIASISQNVNTLLLGWSLIEGIGAALMMPATASLLMSTFRGKERAVAFGIWGGVAGAAAAIGPILGGYLTTNYSWHWAFRINIFTVLLLLIGSVVIKESRDQNAKRAFDFPGVLLSGAGLVSFVYGTTKASTYGWWTAKEAFSLFGKNIEPFGLSVVPFFMAFGLLLLFFFVLWELHIEKKDKTPLVSVGLFNNRQFSSGIITLIILVLGQSGLIFSIPIFLQAVRGLDAFQTGVSLLPLSISLLVAAPLAGVLSRKITPKYIIQFGLVLDIVAVFVLRAALKADIEPGQLAPGLIIFGIGMGTVSAQITNLILSAVDVRAAGEASGINSTARQIGSTLGAAIIGTIFLSTLVSSVQSSLDKNPYIPDTVKATIVQQVESNSVGTEDQTNSSAPSQPGMPDMGAQIVQIKNESMVDANKTALLYTGLFTGLCIIASLFLPKTDVSLENGRPVADH